MHIPKWVLLALTFFGAVFIGWASHMAAADVSGQPESSTAPGGVSAPAASAGTVFGPPSTPTAAAAPDASSPPAGQGIPTPGLPAAPGVPAALSAPVVYVPVYVNVTIVTGAPGAAAAPPVPFSSIPVPSGAQGLRQGTSGAAPADPPPSSMRRAAGAPRKEVDAAAPSMGAPPPPSPEAEPSSGSAGPATEVVRALGSSPLEVFAGGTAIVANGNNIVIASDGAIVTVGDNPDVRANTGDAAASGAIAIDSQDSTLSTGDSEQVMSGPSPPQSTAQSGASTSALGPSPQLAPQSATAGAAPGEAGRAISIAGYESHSLEVVGSDNVLTYDDSNVFMHRTGTFNGNTGDTDTSGLNVVDVAGSVVRSGASGNSDETLDPPLFNPAWPGTPSVSGLATPTAGGSSASVADINGVSMASGMDSLVIGGDGVDDNGVRVYGDRNVVTYDDGNVAIGGSGDVNAQIGDSDTGGAVVMGVRDSDIAAGDSFLPASQQAGAQVGDPFDGDDVDIAPADDPPRLSAPAAQPTSPSTAAP